MIIGDLVKLNMLGLVKYPMWYGLEGIIINIVDNKCSIAVHIPVTTNIALEQQSIRTELIELELLEKVYANETI